MALVSLLLRPMAELPPDSPGGGLLVYAVDKEWNLWLIDVAVARDTPKDFLGWIEQKEVSSMVREINTGLI